MITATATVSDDGLADGRGQVAGRQAAVDQAPVKSAKTTAIAPASVAVKTPKRTPPTMTTGRHSAGSASSKARQRSAPEDRGRLPP